MASLSFPQTPAFASATTRAAACLACRYLSAASGVLRASQPRQDSSFSLTASLTCGVHHRVPGLPPQQAPETLQPQLRTATSALEVENMVHSDSMSPASLEIWSKLSRRWELKTSPIEGSARRSQQTLTIPLGLPSLSSFLNSADPTHHQAVIS